jgi:chitodextrinase
MRNRMNNKILGILISPVAAVVIAGCADPVAAPSADTVDPPPPANASPTVVFNTNCTLLDCTFDAAASSDVDGTINDYSWEFGDGATSTGVNPSHSYGADGNYVIVLTVSDNGGASSDGSQSVSVVSAGSSNNPPTASFSSACTDLMCNFDAAASTDSDGAIGSYDWDYGDGAASTGLTSGHIYATGGTYSVVLTVTDNVGATSSSSQDLTVNGGGAPPDGQALFMQSCSTCHGADALGGTLAKISIVGKTAQEITDAIMSVPNMSSLGSLTAAEIQAIADHLATL